MKLHGNTGNKNAEKPEQEKLDANFQMRLTTADKNKMIRNARGQSLAKFILSRCLPE
jgi:hypothetical protein